MIKVEKLTKIYGVHKALDDVSFEVKQGEVLGFLGPNGAGKTTAMNIMTGYISGTSGDVFIGGIDVLVEPEAAKRHIGYLPETPPLYLDMRVDEFLTFVADIKGVSKSARSVMLSAIKVAARINDVSKRLIRNLSKGYRQRVGLAAAIVGYPSVIIMDEPTVGLDPKQIIEMRDVIKNLGKKHTIILSSHIMQEVSAVCDRVMIINKGRIVAEGEPEKLSKSASGALLVRIKGEKDAIEKALNDYPLIKNIRDAGELEAGTRDYELSADEDIREAVFACAKTHNLPILMMKPLDFSLEEVFLQITREETAS